MRKILLATVIASAFALPAFAQVAPPPGTQATTQSGASATATPSITDMENPASSNAAGEDATSTSNLGLGGLLQQQTQSGNAGAGEDQPAMPRLLDTKPRTKKAHGH